MSLSSLSKHWGFDSKFKEKLIAVKVNVADDGTDVHLNFSKSAVV